MIEDVRSDQLTSLIKQDHQQDSSDCVLLIALVENKYPVLFYLKAVTEGQLR